MQGMATFIAIFFTIPSVVITLYYLPLLLMRCFCSYDKINTDITETNKFLILIPAHNEEIVLSRCLRSCLHLNYPKNKYEIILIADNCSDSTVKIGKKAEILVFERNDTLLKGKGHALSWALNKIKSIKIDFDAVVVLDADCRIEMGALNTFNYYLKNGHKVLQANNISSNPDDSPQSLLISIGNKIENELIWVPKSQMGLSVFLRGTGMAFHKSILEELPWNAQSIAEDTEFSINLLKLGKKIKFVTNTFITSESPSFSDQLSMQRKRWAGGNALLSKKYSWNLLIDGIRKKNNLIFEAGLFLLVQSRPLSVLVIIVNVLVIFILNFLTPSKLLNHLFFAPLAATVTLFISFLIGFIMIGITNKRIFMISATPFVVIRLIMIAFNAYFGKIDNVWTKTRRVE